MKIDRPVDFDDPTQWSILFDELRRIKGRKRVQVWTERRKAKPNQFGYYFQVILPIAKDFLNETQGGDEQGNDLDEDDTDLWLKNHLRGRDVYNKRTGEYMGRVIPSKAVWDTHERYTFVDDVIALLRAGGVKRIPPSDKNWREARERAMREQRSVA
jgi:hypothetical protein